jgi:GNAT superfamily N-acetyltransferase
MRIVIRRMRPEDRAFVVSSWVASFRRSPHAGMISMESWRDVMTAEVERVLARPRVKVLVVSDADAVDHLADLIGHLVWQEPSTAAEPPLVFFTYVKHGYRGNGFARRLFRVAGIDPTSPFNYVCQTRAAASLAEAGKLPRARWRPLLGRSNERSPQHEREDREDRPESA